MLALWLRGCYSLFIHTVITCVVGAFVVVVGIVVVSNYSTTEEILHCYPSLFSLSAIAIHLFILTAITLNVVVVFVVVVVSVVVVVVHVSNS